MQCCTSVTIPEGITQIGDSTFSRCTSLTSVTIPASVTTIESSTFAYCSRLTNVSITEGVKSIGWGAFDRCIGLTSVTIPAGVEYIGEMAFRDCRNLVSVTFPASGTTVGKGAFEGCTGLTSVTIPAGVESIEHAFPGCTGLTSVALWDGVTLVNDSMFAGCSNLTSVTIPDSVIMIGRYAFSGCTGLSSVTIPKDVTWIRDSAFSDCTGLSSVTIPDAVTEIGYSAFSRCTGLTSVIIPGSVTTIGRHAFSGCTGLTGVTFREGIASIGEWAFSGCTGLTSVTIPERVTEIGRYAFENCTGLVSVTLPDSVTTIGDGAFSGCMGLTSVNVPECVTSIANAFSGCTNLESVTIREGITSIKAEIFSGCAHLKSVIIPESITSIETGAFRDCSGLTSVTIPKGVTTIGSYAFSGCTGLTGVTIPESVESIEAGVFSGCTGLTNISIPAGITTIETEMFKSCTGLTSVTIPASVTTIYGEAFANCPGLTSVAIPNSVFWIGEDAFSHCTGLTSVTIPASIIRGGAFAYCTSLQSVSIPDSVAHIESKTFIGCTSLTSMRIPANVKWIGESAFAICDELRDVYYAGTEAQWSQISIDSGNEDLTDAAIHYNDQSHASYMVTFHANGGTVSLPGMTVVSAQPYGALPTPVRKGHTFVGWFTQAAGGSQVTAETTVDLTENQTLYAHWTQDKRPTFEALTYGDIDNSRAAFGYPDGYRIPLERYISVFGDNVMARRAYELAGEWNGSCYGMSATSALFFQGDGGITPDSFRSGAANPAALELTDKSEALDLTLLAFIEQLQVSQYASVIQAYSNSTRNDYSGLAAAVRAFQETGEDPVVIVDATHAHTLVGYELQEAGGETRLMVYDCSAPAEAKYLVLSKNEAENYTSCFYGGGNIEVYYIPYAAFYQVWSDHTGTVEVPMDLLDINVPNAEIYDADGTLAAQLKDGALETQRTDIYELTHAGAAGSSRTGSAIWVPAGRQYVVKNTDTAVKTLEVTMVSMEQSVSVTTGGSQVVLAVDDAKASNFVKVENPEAPGTDTGYTVTMESTLTQQPTVVTVSGNLGTSAAPEVRQEGGTLSVTNTGSIGQDTTVKVNEQEITQAELKDGSTLDLDQLMRSPITATLQANGTVELSRAPYGVRYVFAASYEAGRMTGMVQGTLQGKTVTFQGPVSKGFQLFFLDGSYAPLCDKVAVG